MNSVLRARIRNLIEGVGSVRALALYVGDAGLPAAPRVGPFSIVHPPARSHDRTPRSRDQTPARAVDR
jgi:hypothetical protein